MFKKICSLEGGFKTEEEIAFAAIISMSIQSK